jgi:hypothetical protein
MTCCAECFGDRGLRKSIIPLLSTKIGTCPYCGSENVAVVEASLLADYFELLISAYKEDMNGKLLLQWLREDWSLFGHQKMDDVRATNLLIEILADGDIVQKTFSPSNDFETTNLSAWEKLRDELMYQNRFFPQAIIDLARLERLLSPLTLDSEEVPVLRYRARIQNGDVPFTAAEMGAPPNRIASYGRANPAGIPYLYLGSAQATAISEIRPHTGETVCVVNFKTPNKLKLVDLRIPRKMVSPFLLEDAADIGRMRADLPWLERLGDELTRPVVPQSAAIDYTPSQYLCEFIKKCGYQGVVYRSSVSDGINLALFYPALAVAGTVTQYRVTRVSVDVLRLEHAS